VVALQSQKGILGHAASLERQEHTSANYENHCERRVAERGQIIFNVPQVSVKAE